MTAGFAAKLPFTSEALQVAAGRRTQIPRPHFESARYQIRTRAASGRHMAWLVRTPNAS